MNVRDIPKDAKIKFDILNLWYPNLATVVDNPSDKFRKVMCGGTYGVIVKIMVEQIKEVLTENGWEFVEQNESVET